MIRAILHLLSEAAWTVVFKLNERRYPEEPETPQSSDEAARVRTEWIRSHWGEW